MSKAALSMPDLLDRVLRHIPHKRDKPQIVGLAEELGFSKSSVHSWLVSRTANPGGMATLMLLEWVENREKQAPQDVHSKRIAKNRSES